MDILANTYPDRNLTESRRIAYRAGWSAATTGRAYDGWKGVIAVIRDSGLRFDEVECAKAYRTAYARRTSALLAATVEG